MTDPFDSWIGKTESTRETAELWPARGLAAALDQEFSAKLGDPIPLLAHWTYFAPMVRQSKIGFDGHPERGGFIPPIPQPRRMWAASEIAFHRPICFGESVEKVSRIAQISKKEGASGDLVFLEISHDYRVGDETCLSETQTVVYRDPPEQGEVPRSKAAPENAQWSEEVATDSTRLFRYSAVTFNAHRIHYDHPYVTEDEGYPNIIVQGQFIATMLMQAMMRANPDRSPSLFSFRAMKPIFSGETFFAEGNLEGEEKRLWARGENGDTRMLAKINF